MSAAVGVDRARLSPANAGAALAGLHALELAVERRPWSRAALGAELAAVDRAWIVAEEDGIPVAFAGSVRLGDDVHVLRLTVSEAHRRRGIGGALLDDLVDLARAEGAAAITLEVRAGNDAARALYGTRGFSERGRRPGYYADGEDALLLTLDLGASAGDDVREVD